jgi:hypothetical protein
MVSGSTFEPYASCIQVRGTSANLAGAMFATIYLSSPLKNFSQQFTKETEKTKHLTELPVCGQDMYPGLPKQK